MIAAVGSSSSRPQGVAHVRRWGGWRRGRPGLADARGV